MTPTIGWSDFAKGRNRKGTGYSYSVLCDAGVVSLVQDSWDGRQPGQGESDTSRKVVVPVPACGICFTPYFYSPYILLTDGMDAVQAKVMRRQPGEDIFVRNYISSFDANTFGLKPEPAKFVSIVCYSAEALLENGGTRSTDCEWEIVTIIASPVEREPMSPLTMARNQLEKAGGTKGVYTAEQYAEAIYYWSQRVPILDDEK